MVTVRRARRKHLHIIAYDGSRLAIERTGQIRAGTVDLLCDTIRKEPSSLFVAERIDQVLSDVNGRFEGDPQWQFKVKAITKEVWRPDKPKLEIHKTIVAFFGFRDSNRHNNYHQCLDPSVFINATVRELVPNHDDRLIGLLAWAVQVRDWILANKLNYSPTAGGLTAQLLRDGRFYPNPRRKIPRATNSKARPTLPGNLYRLTSRDRLHRRATYLDQESSHHNSALRINFPHSDSLYAWGRFRNLVDKPAAEWPDRLRENGLFYGRLRVPYPIPGKFPLPFAENMGSHKVWFYSNELSYLLEHGCEVQYLIAGWTSSESDSGLSTYARWALDELRSTRTQDVRWLKPTLLTTYGLLAAKPRPIRFGFAQANGPREAFPLNGTYIHAHARSTTKPVEASICNVIHRGMIEAETRLESLRFAEFLTKYKRQVLAIYADSVFCDAGPLPLLHHPWRIKAELTDLEFFAPTAFASQEMRRLPGIPREHRERLSRLDQIRALNRVDIDVHA